MHTMAPDLYPAPSTIHMGTTRDRLIPLRGLEPSTFAHYTITARLPPIVRRVLTENALTPDAVDDLKALLNDTLEGRLRPLNSHAPRFSDMPEHLYQQLQMSDLIISKGDLNYRRLLGDYVRPCTTPFAEIVGYAPAPVLALRTLKAELAAGLQVGQLERLDRLAPDWLTSGQWGVIQFSLAA